MKINYVCLGSFCHPKIFIRNTNREIGESLPFDFHSSPNTHSIYYILEKLHEDKTFIHQFNKILDENGYYFYTEAVLYTDSLDSEDLFKTEYPRMTNDAIKVFLKDFADFLEGKIENERYSIIKTVKNKKEHYYIPNVKYNVAVGSHYFLRMKIDKKERVITLL